MMLLMMMMAWCNIIDLTIYLSGQSVSHIVRGYMINDDDDDDDGDVDVDDDDFHFLFIQFIDIFQQKKIMSMMMMMTKFRFFSISFSRLSFGTKKIKYRNIDNVKCFEKILIFFLVFFVYNFTISNMVISICVCGCTSCHLWIDRNERNNNVKTFDSIRSFSFRRCCCCCHWRPSPMIIIMMFYKWFFNVFFGTASIIIF